MKRSIAILCWLPVMLMASGWQSAVQSRTSFVTVVGVAGTDSFVFGAELWAVSQVELLPNQHFFLELREVRSENDRVRQLSDGSADFALVRPDALTPLDRELRSIMALWPGGIREIDTEATHLVVRAGVPENVVYSVTKTIFEQAGKLRRSRKAMGVGSSRDGIAGLVVSLHPGAHRYYDELGLAYDLDSMEAPHRTEQVQANDVVDADRLQLHEARQLAVACRLAAAIGVVDYEESDTLSEICLTYAADVAVTESSLGQGGPKLSVQGDEDVDRRGMKIGSTPTM